MQAENLQGRLVKVTRRCPGLKGFISSGENLLLKRDNTNAINQVWVSDVTFIKVGGRQVYLIVIMDRHSRRVLGWSLSRTRTVSDTLVVLNRVISKRDVPKDIIFHTDRGVEFTGHRFRAVLKQHKILASVNRLGFCTDNAHMESFFHSLKTEMIRGRSFKNEKDLRLALNSYINQFYNYKRLHSGIGYCSPVNYERMAA